MSVPVTFNPMIIKKPSKQRKAYTRFDPDSMVNSMFDIHQYNLQKSFKMYTDIDQKIRDEYVTEASGIPGFKNMNSGILAAAFTLFFYTKRTTELTPSLFKSAIERVIGPLEPDLTIPAELREELIERLKADIYRYCRHLLDYRQERLNF